MEMEFNSSVERLQYLIEKSGKSNRAFAVGAKMDSSNLSKILNGTIGLSASTAQKIEDAYGYSSMWLMKGKGEVELNGWKKDIQIKGGVPYFETLPASAGQYDLSTIVKNEHTRTYINIPGLNEGMFAFPVIGCSMEPLIKSGDIVVVVEVSSWDRVDPDKIYMIITHEDRMIKHLSVDNNDDEILWCISENENYSKFKISKSEIKKIFRVTFHGRLL